MQRMFTFANGLTTLHFNEETGYLEGISRNGAYTPLVSRLWKIETGTQVLSIRDMARFYYEQYADVLKLYWEKDTAQVIVTVKADAGEKFRWNLQVQLLVGGTVGKVHFPLFEGLRFTEENDLIITWQNGRILKNPVENFLCKGVQVPFWMGRGKYGYENDYPAGLSYQYTAFYAPKEFGYYFATEDPNAHFKSYCYYYNEALHAMDFYITNCPENMGKTSSYWMPYDFVMVLFEGDWQDATKLYRSWAVKQKWCKEKLTNKYIPETVQKSDLWRINHTDDALGTRTQEYFDTSVYLRDTANADLALHWYGYNQFTEHDWNTPEYFSEELKASGWPEELRQWNKKFTEAGIVKIPYTNARLWERTTKSFQEEDGMSVTIKGEDGSFVNEPWTPIQHLTTICPSCALWHKKMTDMCKEYILGLDFDGAYLDQVASFNAMLCFDEAHPHPRGGGSWWNDSYHKLLAEVRNVMGKDRIMTTESCCETYVDVFDLFLILDINFQHNAFAALTDGNVEQLPLFPMIYGDYALSYGSVCCFTHPANRFEYNFIRNILWGIIPSVEAGTAEQLAAASDHMEAVKRGVAFYKENKEVLFYGRPVELPKYTCTADWTVDWVARDEQKQLHPYTKTGPAVYAVIWESAKGEHFLFAYNYSPDPQKIELNGTQYSVAGKGFISQKLS